MKLEKLLNGIDYSLISGNIDMDINNIQYDSRKVSAGDAFFCISGYSVDGHDYASAAIQKGAAVVFCERDLQLDKSLTVVKVFDSRKAMARAAANFYDNPSRKMTVIGITGTNGKTTSTYMMKSILEEAGHKVGLIGTIANYIGSKRLHTERTTPESLELQQLFGEMVDNQVEYCVMEVSSHSLELDRVYDVCFKYGIFTNLTQDHLDFHKTFENYYNAKLKLFKNSEISILNADDEYGKRVHKNITGERLTYGIDSEADVRASAIKMHSRGVEYKLNYDNKSSDIKIFIPGKYNVYNSLCAAAVCLMEDINIDTIEKGLEKVQVPGRCELVTKDYSLGYDVIVDYAHTPDGLDNILKTAREFTRGRLISVFGCGGNRDKTKRPIMGRIGTELSDIAIITSDNPREEEPMEIIKDIVDGISKDNYVVIENRREAIEKAIHMANNNDVIVIAGKGHEDYQILKNHEVIHFDEREIVKEILDKMLT